jgi:predicted transcriptional regulator
VTEVPEGLTGRTVADAMLTEPTLASPDTSVAELRTSFENDHLHAALVVDADGCLVRVVDPADLLGRRPGEAASDVGVLAGRVLRADTDLALTWWAMLASGRRRLAVTDPDGRLLGLLCLKRSGAGFCSDAGVAERRAARASATPAPR